MPAVAVRKKPFDPVEAGKRAVSAMRKAEGGAWTGGRLRDEFGLDPATLSSQRKEHGILWWKNAAGRFHYPKWQFGPDGVPLPGVRDVLRTLRSADQWRIMGYFLAPRKQLGNRSPLELIRAGKAAAVVAHAKRHAEAGTW